MAKKKQSITEVFADHFREDLSQSIDELTDYVELYAEKPNIKKLIRQYHRNIANRVVCKIRAEDGSRTVYADKKNDLYVDIEHEENIERLANIRSTLAYQSTGNRKAYNRVTKRLAELNGQTVLEFEVNHPLLGEVYAS